MLEFRAVCLLLDKRVAHRERIRREFPFPVEFFLAGDGSLPERYDHIDTGELPRGTYPAWTRRPNSFNAFRCFREIVRRAAAAGDPALLLLEDDASPVRMDLWGAVQEQLPPDWDALYLGANHRFARTEPVSANLVRVFGSGCFHAVLLRAGLYADVLALPMEDPIDGVFARHLHRRRLCLAARPDLVLPLPGYSYCEGREVDYGGFFT